MTAPRGIGRDIWALSVATFINRATGFLGLFAAIFFSVTGMDPGTVVVALVVVGVAGVAGSVIGGQLADHVGKVPVLVGSTLVNVVLFTALALVDHALTGWVIALSAVSVLVSQAFVGPASALVAQSAEGPERVTRFAFYRIFINVGSIVAPALVGLIGRDHFPTLFWLSAVGSLIVPAVLVAGSRAGAGSRTAGAGEGTTAPSARDTPTTATTAQGGVDPSPTPRHRATLPLPLVYAAMALTMVVYAQHHSAVPLRLDDEPGGVGLYSLLLIINPVIVIAVEFPLSMVTKRIPGHLALGVVVMGTGVTVTGVFAGTAALAVAGWVLFSVGECVFAPMSNSYVAELSDTSGQARAQGRLAAVQAVGSALGPGIGSWMLLVLAAGAWAGFLGLTVAAAVLVLAAAALAATRRGDPRRAAARPAAATDAGPTATCTADPHPREQ
ncbi:MFS transporter [Corynebacterium bovis]|uniref:MFS transporter n=1 Tax=Corynebacterium bovis TaxID=36808 RepID=UPI003138BB68